MRARRRVGVVGAVACASLAISLATAAASGDSIKLVLPKHLALHTRVTLVLKGFASGTKPELYLYSQGSKCGSTFTAENRTRKLTLWLTGVHVHDGTYRFSESSGFAEPTHGSQNFCAYLTSFSPTFAFITEAHEFVRFKVPR